MIENIRNYSGLMIVTLVALFLGFLFIDVGHLRDAGSRSHAYMSIGGRNYDADQYRKLGDSSRQLTEGLQMYEFLSAMGGFSFGGDPEQASETFFVNRVILREAKDKFGINPSEDEVTEFLKTLPPFQNENHQFDSERYKQIVERNIGGMGLAERDLRELAEDILVHRKLSQVLGSGLTANRDFVSTSLVMNSQQIDTEIARIDIEPFKAKITPTDEEVKTYWDSIQDSFKTEPKRKFTYFVATPQLPEAKAAEPKPEDGAAKPEGEAKPDPTQEDPKLAEERLKKQRELDSKVDDFLYELEQKKGSNFEELAKESGFEIKTTDLFAVDAAPADLAVTVRSSGRGGRAVDSLFGIKETSDPFSKISDAIAVGENQWIVARLDGEEPARTKTFPEAQEEAKAQLIAEKAREAMTKSANESLAKIREAVAAKKSFADAAKEAGLETKTISSVSGAYRPDPKTEPMELFKAASLVDPGTVADLISEPERCFILFVAKREIVKTPEAGARIDGALANFTQRNSRLAVQSWLAEQVEAAKVQRLYKQQN